MPGAGITQVSSTDLRSNSDSTEGVSIGTYVQDDLGRGFRFCKAGAANLDPGKLTVAATVVANHENIAVAASAAIGVSQITVTLGATAATENQYADGFITINDATGEGISYRISGHAAAALSTALVVTLAEPIKVALTTSSEASLQASPWSAVVISATDQLDLPTGIPNVTITAGQFGWLQTKGFCAALADEILAVGTTLTIGTGVAGAVEAADLIGEPIVGMAVQAGVDTEYRAVMLSLD